MQGKIDLQPDKVHIDNIYVLDNHHSALSLTGDLAIHKLEVGGVELFVTASDFKVVDNKLGNVRVNSNLEIAGELRAPRIEGDFGISTGQVNLDQILALASDWHTRRSRPNTSRSRMTAPLRHRHHRWMR